MKSPRVILGLAFTLLVSLASATSSSAAANCPPPDAQAKTVGKIKVDNVVVDVKNVDYPKGKTLNPPRSPLVAGVSIRHKPLSSPTGSSLIVWHVTYNGCRGKLNKIIDKKKGFAFEVTDEKGEKTKYAISKRIQVKRGKYDPNWFLLSGPRQLVMVTCTGKRTKAGFSDNLFIFASPIIKG